MKRSMDKRYINHGVFMIGRRVSTFFLSFLYVGGGEGGGYLLRCIVLMRKRMYGETAAVSI